MKHKVIGLTGQTGAGKSTVASMAAALSCQVISADAVAREALQKGSEVLKTLAERFGCDIIEKDGSCRRSVLAERAFSTPENTALLNSITHPWIIRRTQAYIALCDPERLVIFDAPQLYESGGELLCSKVIAVIAPKEVRLRRIMARDGISEQAALLRMNAQHDEGFYTQRADFIINGAMPPEKVRQETEAILKTLMKTEG